MSTTPEHSTPVSSVTEAATAAATHVEGLAKPVAGGVTAMAPESISSLAQLKHASPKLWNQMMIGMSMEIGRIVQESNKRIKEMNREAQRNSR